MFYLGLGSFALAAVLMLVCLAISVWQLFHKQRQISSTVRFLTNLGFGLYTLSIISLLFMQVSQD